jgi:hypothetical protein
VSSTKASNYLKFSLHNGTTNTVVDVLTLNGNKAATFAGTANFGGDVTIGGTTGSAGNALAVNRGSDGAQALRVQNSGEVVVSNNYFYANGAGTSMYVQNSAVFRGSILNDGGDVTIADNLGITGDVTMTKSSGNNILYINSSGGGNPVIYMEDSTRKWGQFVSNGDLFFKDETSNINSLKLDGGNGKAIFAGDIEMNANNKLYGGRVTPRSCYQTATVTGFLIETDISATEYAMFQGRIVLEQFNFGTKQVIEFSATGTNLGAVHTSAGTADINTTIKLFKYNNKWYIHVPAPSTYVTCTAFINKANAYQGHADAHNAIVNLTAAAVPSSGVSGSVDIVCKFSQGDVTFAGKILVGTGATAAASLNAYTQTVSSNLFSALRVIENSGASSYWDIGATNGANTLLNFYHNANTTPKISFTHTGGANFAGDVSLSTANADTILTIANTASGGSTWKIHSASSSSAAAVSSGDFLIRNGSTNVLRLGTNNNAAFAGTIASGAITVTGGSNQTIIDSHTAFDLTDGSKDTLLITNNATTSTVGAIGPTIGFGNMNSDRRTSAIGTIRTGGDHDNMGLAFFTHPGNGNDDTIVKQLELAHDGTATFAGNVNIGGAVDVTGHIQAFTRVYLRESIQVLNKASSGFLNFATRNTSASEAVYDISNVGTLSTAGSGTFSGFVYAEDEIHLTDAGTTRAKLLLNSSDRDNVELRAESLGSTMKFFTVGTEALELDASQNAAFAGIVSVPSGKAFRLYNAAGNGWGELTLNETANKIQFNRGIQPSGDNQSDQLLGTTSKRWHQVHAGSFYGDGSNLTGVTVSGVAWGNITGRPYIVNATIPDIDSTTTTVASVAKATYTAAFFDFVIKKGTNVRSGTVYACHDGTNIEFAETSTVDLGDTSDVTLTVAIDSSNMMFKATTTSNDWSVKSLIRAI